MPEFTDYKPLHTSEEFAALQAETFNAATFGLASLTLGTAAVLVLLPALDTLDLFGHRVGIIASFIMVALLGGSFVSFRGAIKLPKDDAGSPTWSRTQMIFRLRYFRTACAWSQTFALVAVLGTLLLMLLFAKPHVGG